MNNRTQIDLLLEEITQSLGWRPAEEWNSYDFDQLAQRIFEKTDIQLSSVTLKRVFGTVKYQSQPSINTLNTLAQFGNYENWRDFITQKEGASSSPLSSARKARPKIKTWLAVFGLTSVFAIAGILLVSSIPKEQTEIRAEDYTLENTKIGEGIPASVVFEYDASQAPSYSTVEIQQSWDATKRTRVRASDKVHTSIYYYPGFFEAKLIVDENVVQERGVFIPSNGWVTAIERESTPVYVSTSLTQTDEGLGISPDYLEEKGFLSQHESFWTKYSLVQKFDSYSDDFRFSAKVKSAQLGGVHVCEKIKAMVLFEGDAVVVPLSKQGCIAEINLHTPDKNFDGKKEDLSMFGLTSNDWTNVGIFCRDQQLFITINGEVAKTVALTAKPKSIVGFRFRFEGSGWVKDVRLNGEVIL